MQRSNSHNGILLVGFCFAIVAGICVPPLPATAQPTKGEVIVSMHRAIDFFCQHASAEGGYVYQLSADLQQREGEAKVGSTTAWIQPPGTPAVGNSYLKAYQLCGDPRLLDAAKETADALIRGQLRSGGWDSRIEFDPDDRKRYAYRVDSNEGKKLRNSTTFDDNKSQSAITFLMRLDQELDFHDKRVHESISYALDAAIQAQYACGAWPQRYRKFPEPKDTPPRDSTNSNSASLLRATIPTSWPRTYPSHKYGDHYTLNDNAISDLITMMLDAWEIYEQDQYLESAELGGEFLIRAQLPEPQPGWAQQYDHQMHPVWARKFEPPAITGAESQHVMRTLMLLYRRTAATRQHAERFLQPLSPAIAYFRRSLLDDGRLARFYELGTNRPLFFTKDYQLTYASDDMPTHYAFIIRSNLDRIERDFKRIRETPRDQLWNPKKTSIAKRSSSLHRRVEEIIEQLDSRGAWVEPGRLHYHGEDDATRQVIRSETFAKNLVVMAQWLGAEE